MTKYLITSALPYANGPLHFGHLAGAYLPADIYTRHLKLKGETAIHISGSDEHGVAIMLNAQKAKSPYKEYVDGWHKDHKEIFSRYEIEFDFFGQTSEPYHAVETVKWFKVLHEKGYIEPKDNQQLQCNSCHNHLPDRFVEGVCYHCGYDKARGDECPNCGNLIDSVKLKNPVCQICKSTDIKEVTVTQQYLMLSKYHKEYRKWFENPRLRETWRNTVYPYVDSMTKESLHERAITRDVDWGIDLPLPNSAGKKLYVWFDAPIGYVSNTKELCKARPELGDYLKDWWKNDDTKIIHFIGKDNIIFHTIIFPVMGMSSGIINPPTDVPANQYVNLNGKQFSKSQGHYVDSREAIDDFGATALRYYLINLIPESMDSSFTWDGMVAKVNNELANNIGNLVSRCLKFIEKNYQGELAAKYFASFLDSAQGKKCAADLKEHQNILDHIQIRKSIEHLMKIGFDANTYFTERAPWAQFKTDTEAAAETLAYASAYILILGVAFAPYLPGMSEKLLSHFPALTSAQKSHIYGGDLIVLNDYFKNGLKLQKPVEMLVPKLDEKKLAELQKALEAK